MLAKFWVLGISLAVCGVISKPGVVDTSWIELGRTDPDSKITLRVWLKNQNLDFLHDELMEISDPRHKRYGQWYTSEEVLELTKPTKAAVKGVKSWLEGYNLPYEAGASNEQVLIVHTTVGKVEELLNCEYYDYESLVTEGFVVHRLRKGTNYATPNKITPFVSLITPTTIFPPQRTKFEAYFSSKFIGDSDANTPDHLHKMYQVPTGTVGTNSTNTAGVASFIGQFYDMDDLNQFWSTYSIPSTNVTNNPTDQQSGYGVEAEMDTQQLSSMGQEINMQVWYTSEASYVVWAQNAINAGSAGPRIWSVSYTGPESSFGQSGVDQTNAVFLQLTSTGVSILFATGDYGAGNLCVGDEAFIPEYPAASIYVTAVGGLQDGNAGQVPSGEACWFEETYSSGGGFGNLNPQQDWQKDAIAAYLSSANSLPKPNQYNASGRGYPDISAQAQIQFPVIRKGEVTTSGGTSAATPVTSGIFALLNDMRLNAGKPTMGFLNPFIYQTAASVENAFMDVVTGTNAGCQNGAGVWTQGFDAIQGWDASTGWGSPNFDILSQEVMKI